MLLILGLMVIIITNEITLLRVNFKLDDMERRLNELHRLSENDKKRR